MLVLLVVVVMVVVVAVAVVAVAGLAVLAVEVEAEDAMDMVEDIATLFWESLVVSNAVAAGKTNVDVAMVASIFSSCGDVLFRSLVGRFMALFFGCLGPNRSTYETP